MRIAGIDASTNKTGISIFTDGKYETHTLIDLHKIKNSNERITKMMLAICDYLGQYQVNKIIMEESVMTNNISTVKMLSNLAGAIMYYAIANDIEFELVLPTAWRKRIGLSQSSKIKRDILKAEAILAVKQEYGMCVTDDEAESLLICRSGFNLPQIIISEDNLWDNI